MLTKGPVTDEMFTEFLRWLLVNASSPLKSVARFVAGIAVGSRNTPCWEACYGLYLDRSFVGWNALAPL